MKDYLSGDEKLKYFYGEKPNLESFAKQIELKSKEKLNRKLLVEVLNQQNKEFEISDITQANITSLLSENTFTVTTGHQLCLFTGPLYFLYKIITTINLAEELTEKYPNQNFVPVYWMASEDHDFDEISFFNVFGKKVKWETEQAGAVGEMETVGMSEVLDEFQQILGESDNAKELLTLFENAYLKHSNLSDSTRYLVNELFGKYGLVIINGNNSELKRQFTDVIKKDVFEGITFDKVEKTNQELNKNYKLQINPREINFFYLKNGIRERIIKVGEQYQINNTNLAFSKTELEAEIESNPERFSPNVVLRPLFQESILPNLTYIGGGGELAYWLQLKSAFDAYELIYPILTLRNSALIIGKSESKKIQKLGLKTEDLFQTKDEIIKGYVKTHSEVSFKEENMIIDALFAQLLIKAKSIDASLEGTVLGEEKQALKSIQKIESKILKAQKRQSETSINQIEKLKEKLFPNNSLQERQTNFAEFYLKFGSTFIHELKNELKPFSEVTLIKE